MSVIKISMILFFALSCTIAVQASQRPSQEKSNVTIVYIVRHAEKVDENSDALSPPGKARAKTLQWMLREVSFDTIYSTNTKRTKNTVKPIAASCGVKITSYNPRPGSLAKTIKQKSFGKTVLVSGHSNTIPQLLGELGVKINEKILAGYDDLFIVFIVKDSQGEIVSTSLQRLHYPGK